MGKRRRRKRPRVQLGAVHVRAYPVLRRAIEEGAHAGVRRAHKHEVHPGHEAIADAVVDAVMLALDEVMRFPEDDRG
ncbi:hypothetical protein L6R52_25825 [Myxococcota bacterium]|nr:hypothetical protein [Myxococcota bacterium]